VIACYRICANAVQTLFLNTLTSLTKDLTKMGTKAGMSFTVASLACLAGPLVAGVLLVTEGELCLGAGFWGGRVCLLGCLCLWGLRLPWRERRRDKWNY